MSSKRDLVERDEFLFGKEENDCSEGKGKNWNADKALIKTSFLVGDCDGGCVRAEKFA